MSSNNMVILSWSFGLLSCFTTSILQICYKRVKGLGKNFLGVNASAIGLINKQELGKTRLTIQQRSRYCVVYM
jgi:hypothetical protein